MTTNKVLYFLFNYNNLNDVMQRCIENIGDYKMEIRGIKEDYLNLSAINSDGMPHSHNAGSDGILNTIIRKDKMLYQIEKRMNRECSRLKETNLMYNIIKAKFQSLPEIKQHVCEDYYFNGEYKNTVRKRYHLTIEETAAILDNFTMDIKEEAEKYD